MPEDEGEPEQMDLEEDENEASDVMPNGGTAVVELNAPEPMHRYMVAFGD